MSSWFLSLRLFFFRLDVFQLTKLSWELWAGIAIGYELNDLDLILGTKVMTPQ